MPFGCTTCAKSLSARCAEKTPSQQRLTSSRCADIVSQRKPASNEGDNTPAFQLPAAASLSLGLPASRPLLRLLREGLCANCARRLFLSESLARCPLCYASFSTQQLKPLATRQVRCLRRGVSAYRQSRRSVARRLLLAFSSLTLWSFFLPSFQVIPIQVGECATFALLWRQRGGGCVFLVQEGRPLSPESQEEKDTGRRLLAEGSPREFLRNKERNRRRKPCASLAGSCCWVFVFVSRRALQFPYSSRGLDGSVEGTGRVCG